MEFRIFSLKSLKYALFQKHSLRPTFLGVLEAFGVEKSYFPRSSLKLAIFIKFHILMILP